MTLGRIKLIGSNPPPQFRIDVRGVFCSERFRLDGPSYVWLDGSEVYLESEEPRFLTRGEKRIGITPSGTIKVFSDYGDEREL